MAARYVALTFARLHISAILPDSHNYGENVFASHGMNGRACGAQCRPTNSIPEKKSPVTDQELKNKYQPVADFMSAHSFQIAHFHVENGKIVLAATAPTDYLKECAWDEIKKIDPSYADLQHEITVGSGAQYTVQSGDNLSRISKNFYGNPNQTQKIAQANGISNPDLIRVGQQLQIPA